jgi:hypothetical protein
MPSKLTWLTDLSRFLWVVFQLVELCTAETDDGIKKILRDLPKDLSQTYDRLLGRIVGEERQALVKRMFRWIICARRPLMVDELCEGIAFTIDDRCWNRDKIPTNILRLVRACGNLVVIDEESKTIQLAHYTVQQYILDDQISGDKYFHFNVEEANELLGEVCVAYLNFSDFETQLTTYVDDGITAGMAAMEKIIANTQLSTNNTGPLDAMSIFNRMIHNKAKPTNIDYSRHMSKKTETVEHLLEDYRLLSYIRENWLWHTSTFLPRGLENNRRDALLHNLVIHKHLPFSCRPWKTHSNPKMKYPYLEPLGWALVTNHCPLIQALLRTDSTFDTNHYFADAVEWFFQDATNTHVSEDMLERLELCAQETWDPKSIPGQGWLYARLINACRRGNLDVIRLLMPELGNLENLYTRLEANLGKNPKDEKGFRSIRYDSWSRISAHLISEAAVNNQQKIVHFLCEELIDARSWKNDPKNTAYQLYLETFRSFTEIRNGGIYNAMERAILAGNSEIAAKLHHYGWEARALTNSGAEVGISFLNAAASEGKARVVEALLEALYMSQLAFGYKKLQDAKYDAFSVGASQGHVAVVQAFLKHNFDPLQMLKNDMCVYMRAIRNKRYKVVEHLLHFLNGWTGDAEFFSKFLARKPWSPNEC